MVNSREMPQPCSICSHPQRHEIEKAVVQGESLRNIVLRFGNCSTASVSRHSKRCVAKALEQVSHARKRIEAERNERSVEVIQQHVTEQAAVTLQTVVTIETELARSFKEVNKLADALDEYLDDPDQPGTYTLDPRADQAMIIWEELEENTVEGQKPKWIKRRGTLQQALALAFSNGHRRLVSAEAISVSDPRELLLKMLAQRCRQIEIMAKLEGRYSVPAPLSDGNTVQLVWIQQVLIQNGLLKG